MIAVVCPNPAIDRHAVVPGFEKGRVHRAESLRVLAGGKGLNVARILAELGHRPTVLGFAGGYAGRQLEEGVRTFGGAPRFTAVGAESRTCYTVVDPVSGTQTLINEQGMPVTTEEVERFWRAFVDEAARSRWVVLSGSLPPGAPVDLYTRMVTFCRQRCVNTVLDTSGAPLEAALQGAAAPTYLKTNRLEYSEAVGHCPNLPHDLWQAASASLRDSVAHIITDGAARVGVVTKAGTWFLYPPKVEVVNAVGAGDAFTAGLVSELATGAPLEAAVRFAVACSSIKVANLTPTLGVDAGRIREIAAKVRIEAAQGAQGPPPASWA
ncbi:1-phosphofructokinase family hexose kinase [Geochorda subterranea]|uniref:Tagatose-6-phosphate kinase n=1 Tax=Geochorda subterranea TaxID=3109564 RepID=A0ABZ1BMK0_9FIRM|nr:1-phosphofructokinase family hexose kinase [Limnochorda sp. LNt]WRP13763.1 1-phosphofructokinase family hexose kinase [Limnochorda sp. LNt]